MSEDNQQPVQEEQSNRTQAPLVSDEDPGELAAMLINQFAPRYKQAVYELGTGEARRLAIALCTWPLEYEDIMTTDSIKNAYALGDRLMQAKFLLISQSLMDKEKQQKEEENKNG